MVSIPEIDVLKVLASQDINLVENNFYFIHIRSDNVRDYRC